MNIADDPLWQKYIKAGFKTWQSESTAKLKGTPHFLQKRVCKGKTTLFFITVYVYDFKGHIGYQPEVQFNTHGNQRPTFDVTYLDGGAPSATVERFFRKIYKFMGCEPYER
mgnify:CR=1 FL=1